MFNHICRKNLKTIHKSFCNTGYSNHFKKLMDLSTRFNEFMFANLPIDPDLKKISIKDIVNNFMTNDPSSLTHSFDIEIAEILKSKSIINLSPFRF